MSREVESDPTWDVEYTYGTVSGTPGVSPDVTGGPQAVTRAVKGDGSIVSYDYDERGNMDGRYVGLGLVHNYKFDNENRLESVTTNNQTMSFAYDADGQRVLTTRHDGTKVYTPFPDYEVEDPPTGQNTTRTTYRIAGQMVAVQVKVGAAAGVFSYTLTDHLGNVVALSTTGGALVSGSLARFDPFGNYRTLPTTNPGTTNHGFTGHRHNNTGVYPTLNVGLIYMNARYYLPEVGRFISPDSIVPEPIEPQSYNRYSYTRNSPINLIDPTGHRECAAPDGSCDPYKSPWVTASQEYEAGQDLTFGPEGSTETHLYGQLSFGPLNLMFDDEEGVILDIYIDIGIHGYASIIGGGVGKEFSFADMNFEGPFYYEVGKGLGVSLLGLGLEYKKALSYRSDDSVNMQYLFTGLFVAVGDGLIFDANSIVIRPSEQASEILATGGEDAWLALFDYLYSAGLVPTGYDYTGSVGQHDSFDYKGIVPIYGFPPSILSQ